MVAAAARPSPTGRRHSMRASAGRKRQRLRASQRGRDVADSELVTGRLSGTARIRSNTSCLGKRSASSTGFVTKSRSERPTRSSRWISLAMNGSDARGKALSTYATEVEAARGGDGRTAARVAASRIQELERAPELLRATPQLITPLDAPSALASQPVGQLGLTSDGLDPRCQRCDIARGHQEARLARSDRVANRADVAGDDGAAARQRLENDIGQPVAV